MSYKEFQPHPVLRTYIDAYWIMKSDQRISVGQRIYPDGCIDIILNLGGDFLTDNGTFTMKNEGAYLVGTMTRYIDIKIDADTYLLGIRFKPLGFTTFFTFSSLHEVTNKSVEFSRKQLPAVYRFDENVIAVLNTFFCNKLPPGDHSLSQVMSTIKSNKGIISIEQVAKQHFTTSRQLERNFKRYLGISPKEYAGFIRYQTAVHVIQNKTYKENLLDVALDAGFYDHAHLTNEIKKYSGLLPSQLQNVGFLQTANNTGGLDLSM